MTILDALIIFPCVVLITYISIRYAKKRKQGFGYMVCYWLLAAFAFMVAWGFVRRLIDQFDHVR